MRAGGCEVRGCVCCFDMRKQKGDGTSRTAARREKRDAWFSPSVFVCRRRAHGCRRAWPGRGCCQRLRYTCTCAWISGGLEQCLGFFHRLGQRLGDLLDLFLVEVEEKQQFRIQVGGFRAAGEAKF